MSQPQIVQPTPRPETWGVGQVPFADGRNGVRIQIANEHGVYVSFLPPEQAVMVGEMILNEGRQAQTGLTVATDLRSVPFPPPRAENPNGHRD